MQQRDIARFCVKTTVADVLEIAVQGGQFVVAGYQARDVLSRASLFIQMKQCFDQFKVNAIKIRIVPTDFLSVDNAMLTTCIAWDRNGADNGQLNFEKLTSYASSKINYVQLGAKTTMSHFIAAETIGEKTSYLSTFNATDHNTAVWDPFFYIGLKGPAALGEDQTYLMAYQMEWTFDVTFRGTRTQLVQAP